jgi:type IV secretion system protein TrbL
MAQELVIMDKIAYLVQTKADSWFTVLQSNALTLFKLLLIIDVIWLGIQAAIKREELTEIIASFVRLLIFASFMLALVIYYKDWANMLISGLSDIAKDLGADASSPSEIFGAGLSMALKIFGEVSAWEPINSVVFMIYALTIIIIFSLIAAHVLLVKCEAYIVLNAGAILLGFGGSAVTKNYAINFLRYSLSVAVKLFVMQLLVSLGKSFIDEFYLKSADYKELAIIIGTAIVLLALVNSIPDIVSGIINGSHVSTGSAITGATTAVATSTMAAMSAMKSAGVGGIHGATAMKGAYDYAKATGATGPVGVASHMAGTLGKAAFGAQDPGTMAKINSAVQAHFESFKMTGDDGSGNKNE